MIAHPTPGPASSLAPGTPGRTTVTFQLAAADGSPEADAVHDSGAIPPPAGPGRWSALGLPVIMMIMAADRRRAAVLLHWQNAQHFAEFALLLSAPSALSLRASLLCFRRPFFRCLVQPGGRFRAGLRF